VLSGTIPDPRKLNPRLDVRMKAIIETALAQDPGKRYATAKELADALEAFALATGEQLTARAIATWVEEVIGPRDAPWHGEPTQAEGTRAGADDRSLVDLIAASAEHAAVDVVDESFGPTDEAASTTLPESTELVRPRRRRTIALAAGITGGLAAGAVATYVTMAGPSPAAYVPELPRMPHVDVVVPAPAPAPPIADEPASPTPTPTPADDEAQAPAKPQPQQRRRTRTTTKTPEPPPPVVVETGPGSGSATGKTKPKWDPTLLLPTDKSKPK
jgi:hypothetical protein